MRSARRARRKQLQQIVTRCRSRPILRRRGVRPRRRNWRKPRACLIWPNGGSTIAFRRAYRARPRSVAKVRAMRSFEGQAVGRPPARRGRRAGIYACDGRWRSTAAIPLPLQGDAHWPPTSTRHPPGPPWACGASSSDDRGDDRLQLLDVRSGRRHVLRDDDLGRGVDGNLRVVALDEPVAGLLNLRFGIREVALRLGAGGRASRALALRLRLAAAPPLPAPLWPRPVFSNRLSRRASSAGSSSPRCSAP